MLATGRGHVLAFEVLLLHVDIQVCRLGEVWAELYAHGLSCPAAPGPAHVNVQLIGTPSLPIPCKGLIQQTCASFEWKKVHTLPRK